MLFETTNLNDLTVTVSTNHGAWSDVIRNEHDHCWAVTLYSAAVARRDVPLTIVVL